MIGHFAHFPVEDVDCFESRLDKRFLSHETKLTITLGSFQPSIFQAGVLRSTEEASLLPSQKSLVQIPARIIFIFTALFLDSFENELISLICNDITNPVSGDVQSQVLQKIIFQYNEFDFWNMAWKN